MRTLTVQTSSDQEFCIQLWNKSPQAVNGYHFEGTQIGAEYSMRFLPQNQSSIDMRKGTETINNWFNDTQGNCQWWC